MQAGPGVGRAMGRQVLHQLGAAAAVLLGAGDPDADGLQEQGFVGGEIGRACDRREPGLVQPRGARQNVAEAGATIARQLLAGRGEAGGEILGPLDNLVMAGAHNQPSRHRSGRGGVLQLRSRYQAQHTALGRRQMQAVEAGRGAAPSAVALDRRDQPAEGRQRPLHLRQSEDLPIGGRQHLQPRLAGLVAPQAPDHDLLGQSEVEGGPHGREFVIKFGQRHRRSPRLSLMQLIIILIYIFVKTFPVARLSGNRDRLALQEVVAQPSLTLSVSPPRKRGSRAGDARSTPGLPHSRG